MAKIRQILKCQNCKYWRRMVTPDEKYCLDLDPPYVEDMARGLCIINGSILNSDSAKSCSDFLESEEISQSSKGFQLREK